jgi:hypothetical protein
MPGQLRLATSKWDGRTLMPHLPFSLESAVQCLTASDAMASVVVVYESDKLECFFKSEHVSGTGSGQ